MLKDSFITPEELGFNLEEDSTDLSEEETIEAIETIDSNEFVRKASKILPKVFGEQPKYELRRKNGILYCRVSVSGQYRVFKVDWLR